MRPAEIGLSVYQKPRAAEPSRRCLREAGNRAKTLAQTLTQNGRRDHKLHCMNRANRVQRAHPTHTTTGNVPELNYWIGFETRHTAAIGLVACPDIRAIWFPESFEWKCVYLGAPLRPYGWFPDGLFKKCLCSPGCGTKGLHSVDERLPQCAPLLLRQGNLLHILGFRVLGFGIKVHG